MQLYGVFRKYMRVGLVRILCVLRTDRVKDTLFVCCQIMDSPGLFDTGKPHEEVSALLMQALACMHPGPDAVLYVMKIGRYTEEEHGVYTRLKALLDENVTSYIIVLFTHGDALRGKSMDEMLKKAPPKLREVLHDCDGRFVVMDNIHRDGSNQVEDLLNVVRRLKLQNVGKPYQCPKYASVGVKMEEEVNKRMAVVEKKELESKKHVQELTSALEKTQEEAKNEKAEFQRKEEEREKAMAAHSQQTEGQLKELAEKLEEKNVSEEQQRQELQAIKTQLQEKESRQREGYQRQRQGEMQRIEVLNQDQDAFLKQLMMMDKMMSLGHQQMHDQQMHDLKDEVSRMKASQSSGSCTIQ